MNKTIIFFLTTLLPIICYSQKKLTIDWEETIYVKNNNDEHQFLVFDGVSYKSNNHPVFTLMEPYVGDAINVDVEISNEVYKSLSNKEIIYFKQKSKVSQVIHIDAAIKSSRGSKYIYISFVPLRINEQSGEIEKLVSFSYKMNFINPIMHLNKKKVTSRFKSTSVLRSGTGSWYKLGVSKDGIYKIDYNFLKKLGIHMDSLNPNGINIYGNGIGMLPVSNSVYRPDDLLKNSIFISGDSDGVFDEEDYILFYAKGPNSIFHNEINNTFSHSKHLFEEQSYYFLNINNLIVDPKRIVKQNASSDAVTHVSTAFSDYIFHEIDRENLIKSGREWYGEKFDVQTRYSFPFVMPNVVTTEKMTLKSVVAAKTLGNSSSSFSISITGAPSEVISILGVGSGSYIPAANEKTHVLEYFPTKSSGNITYSFNKNSATSEGWLNYYEITGRRQLIMTGGQMSFRDPNSIGLGNVVRFELKNAVSVFDVWEITSPTDVKKMDKREDNSMLSFIVNADSLREFIAFDGSTFLIPTLIEKVSSQDLHSLASRDMIIIVPDFLRQAANRIAELHRSEGLTVHVVDPKLIYNEFSSGMEDITSIRMFMKMFYDRANGDESLMPKYLLLFGDGSYDHKDRTTDNTNFIPTYQSENSLSITSSFTTDDYFGLLDDDEAMERSDLLDVAIGRIPVGTLEEANQVVDKIVHYSKSSTTHGDWRNVICLIGDDEDGNSYKTGAERLSDTINLYTKQLVVDKIYLDAYKQNVTPGGERYPDVNEAIRQRIEKGALVVNYIGHGGEVGWAHERVLDVPTIKSFSNKDNMPLFVTATCEFSRFDDPERVSAGELLILNAEGGASALMTTTRVVYSVPNETINKKFMSMLTSNIIDRPTVGELTMWTKNESISSGGHNFRNFTLLGDPAMRLAIPQVNVLTDSLNGVAITESIDTMKALSKVTISGHVEDHKGLLLNDFNGIIFPSVFDKPLILTTLGNDAGSSPEEFELQNNIIYSGKASVLDGYFSFTFIVPKDISFKYGNAKLSYYATNNNVDANGYNEDVLVGGSKVGIIDNKGPEIELFINDESFVPGSITDENPLFFAKVFDENGINTIGNGIGHDITVILDQNTSKTIILNDSYKADLDTYKSGEVRYSFSSMEEGPHELQFKVWDVLNNSSTESIDFIVEKSENLALDKVLNYPNPFTSKTEFMFDHNQINKELEIQIQIFTGAGNLVKTINSFITTDSYRTSGINWDGKDDFGAKLGRGVYVYKVKIITTEGESVERYEKLVILN